MTSKIKRTWNIAFTIFILIVLLLVYFQTVEAESRSVEYNPPIVIDDVGSPLATDGGRHIARDSHGIWYALHTDSESYDDVILTISDDTVPTSFSSHLVLADSEGGLLGEIEGGQNSLEIDRKNVIHVVFSGSEINSPGDSGIYYSKSKINSGCDEAQDWTYANGQVQGAEKIFHGRGSAPVMALHVNGDISIAWVTEDAGIQYLKWNNNEKSWGDIELLNLSHYSGSSEVYRRPMLHIDTGNNIHAVWGEGPTYSQDIIYRVKRNNSNEWTNLFGNGSFDVLYESELDSGDYPSLIVTSGGMVFVTFSTRIERQVYWKEGTFEEGWWEGSGTIYTGMSNCYGSSVGLAENENIVVTYFTGLSGIDGIQLRYWVHDNSLFGDIITSDYELDNAQSVNVERHGKWNSMGIVFFGDYNNEESIFFDKAFLKYGSLPPPVVEIHSPENYSEVSGEVIIDGEAYSEYDSIETVELSFEEDFWKLADGKESWEFKWNTTEFENGEHTIMVRSTDGNSFSETVELTLVVANEIINPIEIFIDDPPNTATVSDIVTISGHCIKNGGNDTIVSVEISIDYSNWSTVSGKENWSYVWDTREYSNGIHDVLIRAFDGDYYSEFVELQFQINNENSIPKISVVTPEDGEIIQDIITFQGTASDEDGDDTIIAVQISIDNGVWKRIEETTAWSYDWNSLLLIDGEHLVRIRAFDGIDYSIIHEIELTVDNVPENVKPIISFISPLPFSEVSGEVYCSGTAIDGNNEIHLMQMSISDGMWFSLQGKEFWTYNWDTSFVENGVHTLRIRSYDGDIYSDEITITLTVHNVEEEDDDNEWYEESFNIGGITSLLVVIFVLLAILFNRKEDTNYGSDSRQYEYSDEDW